MTKKILVVGAGLAGVTVARQLAEHGMLVEVIEKRDHIAGNAYDYTDKNGFRIHKYGPHLFHTNNMEIVNWLSRFTKWVEYKHRVLAILEDGQYVPLPPNKITKKIIGENKIIDVLFKPYTKKMWGLSLEEIDNSILSRIPIRRDYNRLYFPNDKFQALPDLGYTEMVKKILDHKNISFSLNIIFDKEFEKLYDHVFNSMPIDEYFNFEFGHLPYRSIKFHHISLPMPRVLPSPTVNFTHAGPYTRITEWSQLPNHGASAAMTALTYEEPCDYLENNQERYYPVKDSKGFNREVYSKYKGLVPENVTFIGRCGQYVYMDMHQAISSSMALARQYIERST